MQLTIDPALLRLVVEPPEGWFDQVGSHFALEREER